MGLNQSQFSISVQGITMEYICSDPSYESEPSNEYSLLGLTHVMNSIFLDPSSEH